MHGDCLRIPLSADARNVNTVWQWAEQSLHTPFDLEDSPSNFDDSKTCRGSISGGGCRTSRSSR
jgi:hypothetical protein